MAKASKGSGFEREVSKKLSLWWTQDTLCPRDDVFWRTANSGGRATVRGRKGKGTANSYGDLLAVDPIGQPLIQAFTVELKRGYNRCSFADLLDRKPKSAATQYEKWIVKLIETAKQAGSKSWLLIHRRDQREAVAYLPQNAWKFLCFHPCAERLEVCFALGVYNVCAIPLTGFLKGVSPKAVCVLANSKLDYPR